MVTHRKFKNQENFNDFVQAKANYLPKSKT